MNKIYTKDAISVFCSLLLAFICFVTDILFPTGGICAIGFWIILIFLLYYQTNRPKVLYGFAIFFTLLIGVGAVVAPHADETAPLVNRGLIVLIIWVTAEWGIRYKRRQEREMYLAAIVNSSEDAVLGKTLGGRIMSWNKGAERLYGYGMDEMVDHSIDKIIFPEDRSANHELLRRVGMGESIKGHETVRRHKDGTVIDVSLSISPITNSDGEIIGASEFARDISQRKKERIQLVVEKELAQVEAIDTQHELEKAHKELRQARRLSDIGTLAATVAHELRNPLGVIRTAVYNIKRKQTGDKLDSHIANIEKKVRESEQIINNLLTYSRIKMPDFQEVRIADLLLESIQGAPKRFPDYRVDISWESRLAPEESIPADPVQLREVFDNILNNAVQACLEQPARITVRAERTDDRVDISVEDSGEGIDPRDLEEVFKPFFTQKSKGTGLGLAVCRDIVDLHDGEISIASEKGRGTRVTVRLPAVRSQ